MAIRTPVGLALCGRPLPADLPPTQCRAGSLTPPQRNDCHTFNSYHLVLDNNCHCEERSDVAIRFLGIHIGVRIPTR